MLRVHSGAESLAVFIHQGGVRSTTKLVESTALGGFPRQANLIGLTVNRHHRTDDLRERGGGNGPRPQVRARPAGRSHGASNDQLAALDDATGFLDAGSHLLCHRKNTVD